MTAFLVLVDTRGAEERRRKKQCAIVLHKSCFGVEKRLFDFFLFFFFSWKDFCQIRIQDGGAENTTFEKADSAVRQAHCSICDLKPEILTEKMLYAV
jgi:hypothetical protein